MTDELLKQADRDVVHLNWIYNRLELRYNNDRNMDYMQALRRCISNYKALADELRASNETINRQHEMAQKQEKTIKTLSNELRQLESEYDALLNKLGDKCCACSVDKITDICMSHQPRVSELESVVKEACDYLDTNELTTIGSTSILHQKLENAIKPPKEKKDD